MKTVLFDLDGTLLKMDVDVFTKYYLGSLAKKYADIIDPNLIIKAVWAGTKSMVLNDGSKTNEEVFFETFNKITNYHSSNETFISFYLNEFRDTINACVVDDDARVLVDKIKAKNYQLVLATNPIFPKEATYCRMGFVGLDKDEFELVTTYENSCYCKPNIKYYEDICNRLDLDPKDCIMIGNDVDEDMVAKELGMKFFLVTDCLINRNNKKIDADFVGTIKELIDNLDSLL